MLSGWKEQTPSQTFVSQNQWVISDTLQTFNNAPIIGVFHAMAGMAAAMPGLKKFPSAGKEIEANR